jgi:hypothetical protein
MTRYFVEGRERARAVLIVDPAYPVHTVIGKIGRVICSNARRAEKYDVALQSCSNFAFRKKSIGRDFAIDNGHQTPGSDLI